MYLAGVLNCEGVPQAVLHANPPLDCVAPATHVSPVHASVTISYPYFPLQLQQPMAMDF